MQYVCDGLGNKTWFRIETEAEAIAESALMNHAVDKYFRRAHETAMQSYRPEAANTIERDIGLAAHVRREMPVFATLRDGEGNGLATAMLPPRGLDTPSFRIIVVGPGNADPYGDHSEAIAALGTHFGLALTRERCFPYGR